MSRQPWALILGASSGFGAATAYELARQGMNIFGVHLDRRETLARVEALGERIRACGREALFFNGNAADEERRRSFLGAIAARLADPNAPGTVRVLLHSLAFGALKPLTGEGAVTKKQLELTCDVMGHSLVAWVQDLVSGGLMEAGGRIFAMTSGGGAKAIPLYGPVGAAKAVLEAHIRQLALELAPLGITANAILAGVTETPALRAIPGHQRLAEFALLRNPHGRLTTPEDVARAIAVLAQEGTYWITGNTIRVDGGEGTVG
jgi:NAD(P)-dependent dehydrogenase (short-subunit alcohol dehydrogenase family)